MSWTTHSRRLLVAVALLVSALPPLANAQVIERPPRSTGGLFGGSDQPVDPNRTRSTVNLELDALGGWDDDFLAPGESITASESSIEGGYVGVGAASVRFWRGRTRRSFELTGRTHLTSYVSSNIDPLFGAEGSFLGRTSMGRRTELTGTARVSYLPSLTLAAFGPVEGLADSGVVASGDPTRAVTERRSRAVSGSLQLGQEWTTRHRTNLRYEANARRFLDDPSIITRYDEGWAQSASVDQLWDFNRSAGLTGAYRYENLRVRESTGFERPTETHTGEVGVRVRRTLSRTRALAFSGAVGATQVQTVASLTRTPYEYVAPSGSGSIRLDVARTWGVAADYRRDVSVLEGVSLATFLTDAASVTVGGTLNTRLNLAVSGAVSDGEAHGTDLGSFDSRIGTVQLQYEMTNRYSLVSSYTYYEHRVRDLTALLGGVPPRFERNSVRVGVSMDLPLYGNFSSGASGSRNGN